MGEQSLRMAQAICNTYPRSPPASEPVKPLGYFGGWGVLNREIVAFRSCVPTRGLVA